MANELLLLSESTTSKIKRNISENERMYSSAGGAALAIFGLGRILKHPVAAIFQIVAGGLLLRRGLTGHCPAYQAMGKDTADASPAAARAITIKEVVVVNVPKSEVYSFWRKLENLPLFMKHLKKVEETSTTRSHWEAQINDVLGKLEWDAEILEEKEGELIRWASVPGASVENTGEVKFVDVPGNLATEVHATITYNPPAGPLGALAGKLLNSTFASMIQSDLKSFKQVIETKK